MTPAARPVLNHASLLTRRAALLAFSALATSAARAGEASSTADLPAFRAFVRSLEPAANESGVSRATFDHATAALEPDGAVTTRAAAQPEFETPIWIYLQRAAGPGRIAKGLRAAAQWRPELSSIQTTSGVPGEIILAAWGMESDFAQPAQDRDVLSALATLAWLQPRTATFKTEFIAALLMLERGLVDRLRLRGSWAGAMGMPQFMPSAYLRYAVSYRGSAPANIWTSAPDSLASIANFLARTGWRSGLPWGFEADLPKEFDWASLHGDFAEWRRLGVRRADGRAFPRAGAAALFAPAGAGGPCFLLSDNYWVLKQYNNSDSYALSLGCLADALAGRPALRRPWPHDVASLDRADRVSLQKGLAALRLYDGETDGKLGPATREAVHRFERGNGLRPADGLPTAAVLAALKQRLSASP